MNREELIKLSAMLRNEREKALNRVWQEANKAQAVYNLGEALYNYSPAVPIKTIIPDRADNMNVYLHPLMFDMASTMMVYFPPKPLVLTSEYIKPAQHMSDRDHEHVHQDTSPFKISVSWLEESIHHIEAKFEWWWLPTDWTPGPELHFHMPILDAASFVRYNIRYAGIRSAKIYSQSLLTRFPGCFKQGYSSTSRTIPNYFTLYWDMATTRPDNILVGEEFN